MKKRIVVMLMASMMILGAVGCGGSDNGKQVESQKEISAEEKAEEAEEVAEEKEEETDDSTTGEVVEENGLRKEPVATNKELNLEGEVGPFKYIIEVNSPLAF